METSLRARVRAGDPDAFGQLFDENASVIYRHSVRLTGNWVTADDIVSLTFLEAWRLRERLLPGDGSLRPWLLGIATNVTRNTARAARRHQAALAKLPPTVFENVGAALDQATLLPELSAALYRAVAKLPDVRVVRNVKDGAGRTGIGLTYTNRRNPSKTTSGYWVFDSESLAYLGTNRSALLDVAVTDEKGEVTAVGAS
ncbi:sigma factor [Streptomyces hygroscopicus]|uniref:sigma factor n=1 Tax=Streptomyces hygroscopicus TaxID=1912 RepID=UPI0036C249FA